MTHILDIMEQAMSDLETAWKGKPTSLRHVASYKLLVQARLRIHELENQEADVPMMGTDEDGPDFPPVPDGWERFYTLEEYRGEGFKCCGVDDDEWLVSALPPLMLPNLGYIQPAAKSEPTLPDWCPPIPDGWEVMEEGQWRGGAWDCAIPKGTFSVHDPEERDEPSWDSDVVYIQPKEQA